MKSLIGDVVRHGREVAGVSQKELSERLGIDRERISKYERGVNTIPAEMLLSIFSALKLPIHVENGQILIGDDLIMAVQHYSKDFTDFEATLFKIKIENHIKEMRESREKKFNEELDQLRELGYEFLNTRTPGMTSLKMPYTEAGENDIDEQYTIIKKGDKTYNKPYLTVYNTGAINAEFVDFKELLNDLKVAHGDEVANQIEKAITYATTKEHNGDDFIRYIGYQQSEEYLLNICPYIKGYETILTNQVKSKKYLGNLNSECYNYTRTFDWAWLQNLGLVDQYQDHSWRVFWTLPDGEEIEVDKDESMRHLFQVFEIVDAVFEEEYEDMLEKCEEE